MQFRKRNGSARRFAVAVPVSVALVAGSIALAAAPSGGAANVAQPRAAAVKQLGTLFHMKLRNLNSSTDANGVMTGIKQTKGKIGGKLILAPPLYGGGPFTGTVSANAVNFTVKSTPGNPCRCISIVFKGTIGPQGAMSGTYVAKTATHTESGKWRATPHDTFACQIQAVGNHKFVTAEIETQNPTLAGLLRARSDGVGTWQMFQCVAVGKDQWALKSRVNKRFVTTQLAYPGALKGVLRAAAAKVGPNERFNFRPVAGCACYALKAVNKKFVTVDPSSSSALTGMLRAHGGTIGPRQEFLIAAS